MEVNETIVIEKTLVVNKALVIEKAVVVNEAMIIENVVNEATVIKKVCGCKLGYMCRRFMSIPFEDGFRYHGLVRDKQVYIT